VERLSKGEEDNDKWRTFRMGSTVYVVLRRKNKHGQFMELSEYGGGGRRSYVVIPEGSDGKGWLDVGVQLQKLITYHAKQKAGGITFGRKTDAVLKAAPTITSLRREAQSYAAVLGGKASTGGRVSAEGRGNTDFRMEPEKEAPGVESGDHAVERGVLDSKRSAVSIMGNDRQNNLEEAKNLDELKSFLRHFKAEAERWLGLLEMGCVSDKSDAGGLEEGGKGIKAHIENSTMKDPITTDKREDELNCVYSRRSPRKVSTRWQQVTGLSQAPTSQPEKVVLTEQLVSSTGDGKVGIAGRVLLAGSCSTGRPKNRTEGKDQEQETRKLMTPSLQLDSLKPSEQNTSSLGGGKVGLAGRMQEVGACHSALSESCTETSCEQAEERKEDDCGMAEIVRTELSCEGIPVTDSEVDNGGQLSRGTGEQRHAVVEKVMGELGISGGVPDEPEGDMDAPLLVVANPVFLLESGQCVELKSGRRKGGGCLGGEESSYADISSEPEGSKELSSHVFSTEIVEGGVGIELEGVGQISVMPLAVEMDKDFSSSVSPRWVMERVKDYYKLVGVSCDQYEDNLLALFELIEASRAQSMEHSLAMVTTVAGVKGQREIKRLDCSINYDKKGEQSNRRRVKGRDATCVNEA